MDYKNGRIYKIVSDLTEMIYIGSTCQSLCKRLAKHKGNYRESLNGRNNYMTSFELFKLGETRIELIEDFPCERKEQLNAREGYHIKLNKDICVNKNISGRNKKQWREDNKDKIKQYREDNKDKMKQYNADNKAKISEYKKQYRQLNKDKKREQDKQYYANNKAKISEYDKQYYANNKDKINEKKRQNRELNKIKSQINHE